MELLDEDGASLASRQEASVSRRMGGGRIGMEFETGDMFGSPNNRMQLAHEDMIALAQEDAASADDRSVLALLWQDPDTRCGASVGARGKFCIAVNCAVVSHRRASKVPRAGYWYVPISATSTWAMANPTVQDDLISDDLRASLTQRRNPETL